MSESQSVVSPAGSTTESPPNLLRFLRRYTWLIAITLVVAVGVTALWTLRMEPVYRATATLEISPPRTGISAEDLLGVNPLQREYLKTMAMRVTMRDVIQPVFKNHVLTNQSFEEFRESIDAVPEDGTNLVVISLEGTSRERITKVVEQTVAHFMASIAADRAELSASARKVLDTQAEDLRKKILAARSQLDAFLERHGLRSSIQNEWDLMHEQLLEKTTRCESARNLFISTEAVHNEIRRMEAQGEDLSTLPFVLTDPGYVALERTLQGIDQELADTSQDLGEMHPTYRALAKKREKAQAQVERRLRRLVEQAGREYQIRKSTLEQLSRNRDDLAVRLREMDGRKFEYDRIQREVERYQTYYERYLRATGDIDPASDIGRANVRVRESACASTRPIRPNLKLNLALAVLAGLLGGILLGMLIDALRS